MRNSNFSLFFVLLILFTGLYSNRLSACTDGDPSSPVGIVPGYEDGNTPGETATNVKFNSPVAGVYALGTGFVTISFMDGPCGEVMTWSVSENIVIDHVYAKGGPQYNDYDYTSTAPRPSTDGNLHCPLNESGKYADFSHVNFVFRYRLTASKTANAQYTRTYVYDWSIDKSCDGPAELLLSPGQVYNYPFSYEVSATATPTDSEWKVTGTITVYNNTPFAAILSNVVDEMSGGIVATVDCGVVYPYGLGAGQTLICTYTGQLGGPNNGTNTVTVSTSTSAVEGDVATANYAFGNPTTILEVNKSITVTDDCTAPKAFSAPLGGAFTSSYYYTCPISYDECGEYTYTNVASIVNGGSDNCTVAVNVPCGGGCTLTQGYWKTHSEFGPAPYDATWGLLPNGASTPFHLSGQTYHQVLWTPPAGNVYYVLAHQYIAAQLNQLNGASIPAAVLTAYNSATTLFSTKTPAQIAGLKGAAKNTVVTLATTLDNYNNGVTGPGHCSEDGDESEGLQSLPNGSVINSQSGEVHYLIPNPARNEVQINLSDFMGQPVQLQVYNQLGALILNSNIGIVEMPVFNLQLDQSVFVSGLYHVTLRSNNGVRMTHKLVVNQNR